MQGGTAKRFTADEYQRMGQAGIFAEDDRVELIDGEIYAMTPIGPAHAAAVNRTIAALMRAMGNHAIVSPQNPVRLDFFNEPQPDLVLLRPREDFYRSALPQPADVLLVIEIADSSLRYDRDVKAPLYARHGIVEYWLVDLASSTVTSYSSPEGATYRSVAVHARGDWLSPAALIDCRLAVEDLL